VTTAGGPMGVGGTPEGSPGGSGRVRPRGSGGPRGGPPVGRGQGGSPDATGPGGSGRRLAAAPPPGTPPPAAGVPPDPSRPGGEPGAEPAGPPPVWLLHDRATVQARVAALGAELRADYQGVEPILVSVLRGGVIFLADLVRAAAMPCKVDFMAISRFDASEETGVVRIVKDLELDLSGAHVLVVEDVVDTGLTLTYLLRVLAARGPATLRVCALLDKRARRIVDVPLSYVGFEVPDVFAVGYGLDLDEHERGRSEILAVEDLEAVRRDPTLLDRAAGSPGAGGPSGPGPRPGSS
jgi:hypoxanthine phosphoribosyltransferase